MKNSQVKIEDRSSSYVSNYEHHIFSISTMCNIFPHYLNMTKLEGDEKGKRKVVEGFFFLHSTAATSLI
jgi:hypothetical protein